VTVFARRGGMNYDFTLLSQLPAPFERCLTRYKVSSFFLRATYNSSYEYLLLVRVWYTIDGSTQYLLARSSEKQPVTHFPVHEATSQTTPKYAMTTLRPCLDTMCKSRFVRHISVSCYLLYNFLYSFSPELMHDASRDYSVYILDPTESQSAPGVFTDKSKGQGVAVGKGLMSALLTNADLDDSVVGTLSRLPTGDNALEVVFALRGVCYSYLRELV
jgi:hypothetical protein